MASPEAGKSISIFKALNREEPESYTLVYCETPLFIRGFDDIRRAASNFETFGSALPIEAKGETLISVPQIPQRSS